MGPPIKMHLKLKATPVFANSREIPITFRDTFAKEVDKNIKSGFYKKVEYSEWASITHVITKKSGRICITGNYKPRIIIGEHPIPKVEQIFN